MIKAIVIVIICVITFYVGLAVNIHRNKVVSQSEINKKDLLLKECTAIAKKRGKERDIYQRELTDSVVMLRKLDGLTFHPSYDDSSISVSRDNIVLSGDELNEIRMNLNKIQEFTQEQRKRVHWDLEEPIPELRPMSEEEFQKFQESVRAYHK